jgi:hypothetical protein
MRLRTMIIFGAGYIWGARTGHDRLLELTDRARDFLTSDVVRDYLQRAQGATATRATDELAGSESEEPEEFENEDLEDEDLQDEDIEDEDLDEPEPEESGEDGNEEPPPARSRSQVRRRAPGRSRR